MGRKQGEILKEIRKKIGLTQTQLGEKLGVRYNTICGWETGTHKIPTNHLDKICKILNIPPSYLLDEKPTTLEYPIGNITNGKKIDIKEIIPAGTNYLIVKAEDNGLQCLDIEKDDFAIIDTNNKNPNGNSIFAIKLDEKILLRKIKKYKNEIVVVSCNLSECGIYIYHKTEVEIIGEIVRIIRKL